ncbi:flagellar biosynthesis protein FliR [Sodalis-like endosymbiont of Proechinophthirus fluctus]|uniref:flagellar biosynthetic protein FliR n=1 Tax=Sodalis-like endosymbiont of Proechinophthirus fluctus TaxID=1462730 RepID=UPI0007A7F83C|nr:flagellar biosynthetic protein FliR [Sodalis-like endosymbiont of Proechinophthirus fluctus]KYP97214.1 flagellar biosynthesis protein FliR [Sodalis-like endosymbiont of Proechinophthirus fluctus]
MLDLTAIQDAIGSHFWPLARLLGLFVSAPLLSEKMVANKVKIGLAVLITLLIAPGMEPVTTPLVSVAGLWLIMVQLIIGITVGMTLQFAFSTVRFAGEVIGLQMGLSFATFFDPFSGPNSPIISRLFNVLLLLLFVSLDAHLLMIDVLVDTFQLLPISPLPLNGEIFLALARAAGLLFSCGLMLALPAITLLLLLNITLGVLNRLSPQFSVFIIGFPLTLGGGLLALILAMPLLATFAEELFSTLFQYLSTILAAMGSQQT